MKLLGITGKAGSGKDTLADLLMHNHDWIKIGLADPLKVVCGDWFGWDSETLWGPSHLRNKIDPRYGFAPRLALQRLGTEFGRHLYPDLWIDYAMRVYEDLADSDCPGMVIPDVRFPNEAAGIRKHGGRIVRIHRDGINLAADLATHQSEVEMDTIIPDLEVDNNWPLGHLAGQAEELNKL